MQYHANAIQQMTELFSKIQQFDEEMESKVTLNEKLKFIFFLVFDGNIFE